MIVLLLFFVLLMGYILLARFDGVPHRRKVVMLCDRWADAIRPQRRVRRLASRAIAAVSRASLVGLNGGVLVPDRITVGLDPADHALISPMVTWFVEDLREGVKKMAADRGWKLLGPVHISVEGSTDAAPGIPIVRARFGAGTARTVADTSKGNDAQRPATAVAVGQLTIGDRVLPLPVVGQLTVGRDADCGITLDDPLASRLHATIHSHNGQLEVEDLDSSNGTFVNGKRVERCRVADNDAIRVGRSTIVIHLSDKRATQRITSRI